MRKCHLRAPSLPTSLMGSSLNAKLWNCETDKPIYSGELVTLTTRDPVAMPLPSFELLEMQWMLNRIAALSGAADVTDEQLEDEDFWFGEGGELAGSGNHPRYGSWPQPRTH